VLYKTDVALYFKYEFMDVSTTAFFSYLRQKIIPGIPESCKKKKLDNPELIEYLILCKEKIKIYKDKVEKEKKLINRNNKKDWSLPGNYRKYENVKL